MKSWFTSKEVQIITSFQQNLHELEMLCKKGLEQYFEVGETATYQEFLIQVKQKKVLLDKGQKLFLEWIEEKGEPKYMQLFSTQTSQDEERDVATLEYEIYILKDEVQCNDDKNDLRSSLISIAVSHVSEF